MKHDIATPNIPPRSVRILTATTAGGPLPSWRRATILLALAVAAALTLTTVASSASSAGCPVCGKNLIKNPGAEAGRGQNAPGEVGNVPGWTSTAGQFGAAAYTGFGIGWFTASSKGPKNKGKNYFFGGTTPAATSAHASVGTQTIKLPAAATGHKATLSGWLGNYSSNTAQVRAQFTNASGKVLSTIRIGPDTTIGGTDMASEPETEPCPQEPQPSPSLSPSPITPTTTSQAQTTSHSYSGRAFGSSTRDIRDSGRRKRRAAPPAASMGGS